LQLLRENVTRIPDLVVSHISNAAEEIVTLCHRLGIGKEHRMKLVKASERLPINGIVVPNELYWVIRTPTPIASMRYPRTDFPWSSLKAAGFSQVVSLHPGSYDPAPLSIGFAEHIQDLVGGGPPANEANEKMRIKKAVTAVLVAWRSGLGIVVHCIGGRGRTGTVLGCLLRELGFTPAEAINFLDRVHKARGKPGWPESPWQSSLVENWEA
jgi:Swiss Army Knife protein, DSP-PTPase phosphatase domain